MAGILEGKNAVVTGAGRGIGRAVALAMAAAGAKVVVNDLGGARDGSGTAAAPADEVVEEIRKAGGIAIPNYDSVASFSAAERIIRSCVDNFGRIDILVNVAGILRDRMIFNMTEEEWDAVIAVHLKGTFNCCRHACALMRQQRGGHIINFTSGAWRGNTGQANYVAAKAGIVGLTRAIARDMGKYGVTCNAVAPVAATRMTVDPEVFAAAQKVVASGLQTSLRTIDMQNLPLPETVPPVVVYLASDAAANINGRVFRAEGGKVSLYSEPMEEKAIFKREGIWTPEELAEVMPSTLALGLVNPAPPEPPKGSS